MSKLSYTLSPNNSVKSAEIFIPGSKSYTNRSLILAALAEGESVLHYASVSDDSQALIKALQKFGVEIEVTGDKIIVQGSGGKLKPFKGEINVGPAGTSMRFLAALCAFIPDCEVILSGSERMHKRPINDLVESLHKLGAEIQYLADKNCPPLLIKGIRSDGGDVSINGSVSSQFFTALMLSSSLLEGNLKIKVSGEQISKSYIDMTIATLKDFGIEVINKNYKSYELARAQHPKSGHYRIEGDASGASYFWGIAAISGKSVKVKNINPDSAQGDVKFPDILEAMGCTVTKSCDSSDHWIEVSRAAELRGIEVDMSLMPDTAQTLAVIAATATTPTQITGLSTLKIKETDRLLALQTELAKLGIRSEITAESIIIIPSQLNSAAIDTYDDHRMAMSFAMLGSRFDGIVINEPQVVTKSFPNFWEEVERLMIVSS